MLYLHEPLQKQRQCLVLFTELARLFTLNTQVPVACKRQLFVSHIGNRQQTLKGFQKVRVIIFFSFSKIRATVIRAVKINQLLGEMRALKKSSSTLFLGRSFVVSARPGDGSEIVSTRVVAVFAETWWPLRSWCAYVVRKTYVL
jgi:hypothetical protein